MTTPGIVIQFSDVLDDRGTQRVQVNVPDQFEKIGGFLADDRLVTVLEQMAASVVAQKEHKEHMNKTFNRSFSEVMRPTYFCKISFNSSQDCLGFPVSSKEPSVFRYDLNLSTLGNL